MKWKGRNFAEFEVSHPTYALATSFIDKNSFGEIALLLNWDLLHPPAPISWSTPEGFSPYTKTLQLNWTILGLTRRSSWTNWSLGEKSNKREWSEEESGFQNSARFSLHDELEVSDGSCRRHRLWPTSSWSTFFLALGFNTRRRRKEKQKRLIGLKKQDAEIFQPAHFAHPMGPSN